MYDVADKPSLKVQVAAWRAPAATICSRTSGSESASPWPSRKPSAVATCNHTLLEKENPQR